MLAQLMTPRIAFQSAVLDQLRCPNGMSDRLAQVLQALQISNLAKARWLQQRHLGCGGSTPLGLIHHGHLEDVWAPLDQ